MPRAKTQKVTLLRVSLAAKSLPGHATRYANYGVDLSDAKHVDIEPGDEIARTIRGNAAFRCEEVEVSRPVPAEEGSQEGYE